VRRKLQLTTTSIALLLMASMAVGAGVTAVFGDRATATQVITVGEMAIELSSNTEGATVDADGNLVCPPVHITQSTGGINFACNVRIASVGDLQPRAITLSVRAETDGADLSKFGIDMWQPVSGWDTDPGYMALSGELQFVGAPSNTVFSEADMGLRWGYGDPYGPGPLTESDMGKTVTVIYAIDALE
jgi:hypothetical protein